MSKTVLGGHDMGRALPLTIDNGHGEIIRFKEVVHEADGDRLLLEGRVQPGAGPVMHVHYKQDENFRVVRGIMAYQTQGQPTQYLTPGQSATFLRNHPHKFWNSGDDDLVLDCWIKPANNAVFYLSTLYEATNGRKKPDPEPFVGAFLVRRYAGEYGLLELPAFVRKVVIPITYAMGRLLGKYRRFANAPAPV